MKKKHCYQKGAIKNLSVENLLLLQVLHNITD